MRRLLWIGDAACQSGFARNTHALLDVLRHGWDVHVLGINHLGDPHPYGYPIYPAFTGGDAFGVNRLPYLLKAVQPDVIVIQNDPWNFPAYTKSLKVLKNTAPIAGVVAVDGFNCRGAALNDLCLACFWTTFGLMEARRGGFTGTGCVVPLGVDLDVYKPSDKFAARRALKFPPELDNAFIVGNVNRNQQRKRLDLTIEYFAEWLHAKRVTDAYLFLHVAPTGDSDGYDCKQLAQYYGIADRLILRIPPVRTGPSDDVVATSYAAFDAQMTTTQGEGWGLTTMEGMACGVPQIVPDWSALGEWAHDVALAIPCSTTAATINTVNVIGGIPDKVPYVNALDTLYRNRHMRMSMREAGLKLVARPEYRWEAIGHLFADALEEALAELPEPAREEATVG